ncbi:hypothetical protein KC131_20025 [Pseudomonas sp. JQ170]|uniref:accessory Sec system protein Asp2 n=1 Tax=unclassified Pseudomonas TaxID=196821 RepID=UPI00264F1283|nr:MULTISPECIES: accessory Sec system protein Asp2 [unclassified Pseudomonas]MDN7142943.1 hypothetical protein [Pseudomonas sp. JQ170]WRO74559.1 accessory Sec system protein Asp2 [Pseudomonas sp. 170C]
MDELEYKYQATTIKYKFKTRIYDTRHLLVIFSGFGANSEFTYDFENSLQACPANVLWIKDDFGGHCSYYILQNNEFSPEIAVQKLIENTLTSLGLQKDECTLAGFSKGGSAALYHGLKYNYKNIVSTAPQMNIGTYVSNNWEQTAYNMLGPNNAERIELLNGLLPSALKSDKKLDKNIYLLTSEADIQYPTEIEPFKGEFVKYNNFNFFLSCSVLVRAHNQVTAHHTSLLLSIFYALSNNIAPRFGYIELRGDAINEGKKTDIGKPIIQLKTLEARNNKIFIDGIGILKHVSSDQWSDIKFQLKLKDINSSYEISFDLAKDNRPFLTREFYSESFTSYDKSWFCTMKHSGIDSTDIPRGKYQCFLRIIMNGYDRTTTLFSEVSKSSKNSEQTVSTYSSNEGAFITIDHTE